MKQTIMYTLYRPVLPIGCLGAKAILYEHETGIWAFTVESRGAMEGWAISKTGFRSSAEAKIAADQAWEEDTSPYFDSLLMAMLGHTYLKNDLRWMELLHMALTGFFALSGIGLYSRLLLDPNISTESLILLAVGYPLSALVCYWVFAQFSISYWLNQKKPLFDRE